MVIIDRSKEGRGGYLVYMQIGLVGRRWLLKGLEGVLMVGKGDSWFLWGLKMELDMQI